MVIRSLFSAFLMYSRIPVPQVEWKEENRRYALCFFPLVGAAVGGAELLWFWLYRALGFGSLLFGAGAAALPLFITGGIHMDGFCDVCDALASWGSREKLLEIMDDPHIGSFASVRGALYLLLQTAVFAQIKSWPLMLICALTFVQSRALSGLSAVTFKSAKNEGALQSFSRPADKSAVAVSELCILALTLAAAGATDLFCGLFALAGEALALARYRTVSRKRFGGVTGDLAGYFLQICELAAVSLSVLAELVRRAVL